MIFGGACKFTCWLMPKEKPAQLISKPRMTLDPQYGKFHHHNRMQSYGRPTCKHTPSHVAVSKHPKRCWYNTSTWHICQRLWTICHTTYRYNRVDILHIPKQKRTRCIETLSATKGRYIQDESRRNARKIIPPIPRNDIHIGINGLNGGRWLIAPDDACPISVGFRP